MHLTDEQIDRLMQCEPDDHVRRAARAHVDACPECARRTLELQREHREIADALALLDEPMPPVDRAAVIRIATRGRSHRWRTVTVGAALIATAAVAAAMPGSPVRRWLAARANDNAAEPRSRGGSASPVTAIVAEAPRTIAVPASESVEVVFATWQEGGALTIRPTTGTDARLETRDPAAEFAISRNTIRVSNSPRSADYELLVPAAVTRLRVTIDGEVVLERRSGRHVAGPAADASGVVAIALARTAPR
jgi:hypothetical protein